MSSTVRSIEELVAALPWNKRFIVVTGGVMSGIGKGVTTSSVGVLLKFMHHTVTAIKIDPYLNVDAGTMSPYEHGEVFVLNDGSETDLDLGNYERFLNIALTHESNITTGKVYQTVIQRERQGKYLGKTVQIIPHITDEIIRRILTVAMTSINTSENDKDKEDVDIVLIELGGTIGDIESMPFVEALRQLQLLVGVEHFCVIHVSNIPEVGPNKEHKTKPTQHSVKELRSLGISPDFIVCRSSTAIDESNRRKIALFCNVPSHHVISSHDVSNIYQIPAMFITQQLHQTLVQRLQTRVGQAIELDATLVNQWQAFANAVDEVEDEVHVAMIAKYSQQSDAYLSVNNALLHSAIATKQRLVLHTVESSNLEEQMKESHPEAYDEAWAEVRKCHGVLVPGGFGSRGIEGKIAAIQQARTTQQPFLGICLGFQLAVVEFSRHVVGLASATSEEFVLEQQQDQQSASNPDQVIALMPESGVEQLGGTMRLGIQNIHLQEGSVAHRLYQHQSIVTERHRHRYEVNLNYVDALLQHDLQFVGKDDSAKRMEILELSSAKHPFFVASQFHPEYQSRPLYPAPLFVGFMEAMKASKISKK